MSKQMHLGSLSHGVGSHVAGWRMPGAETEKENFELVATVSTTYSEPYNVARMLASLDHLSHGRIGWNVVTGSSPDAAANFSRDKHPPHAERYAMAEEYLEVVKGLWDSWEDGALVGDKATGVFIDTTRMHVLNH